MMKKIYMLILCAVLVPTLYAVNQSDTDMVPQLPGIFSASPVRIIHSDQLPNKYDLTRQEDTIRYCDLTTYNAIGLTSGGTFEYGIRLTIDELAAYAGDNLSAIVWNSYDGSSPTGVVKVYDAGSSTQPGPVLSQDSYTGASSAGWYRIDLTTPVTINGSTDLWCTVEVTHPASTYPASVDAGPYIDEKSQWILYQGTWYELRDLNPAFVWNWQVMAIVTSGGVQHHDVGCQGVVSPPSGSVTPGNYDVTGRIRNFGDFVETFDATATVYDTVTGNPVFGPQTVTLTNFAVGGDSNVTFGQVTFVPDSWYYTEIFTLLVGDENPSNDTCSCYSTTAMSQGDVIFELDVQTPTGDNQCLGVEFDGSYFYVTGGNFGSDPNKLYVLDTLGTLIWTMDQPVGSGWGWRDLAWDNAYAGPDRIDTLYASVTSAVDKFGVNLSTGALDYYGTSCTGPANPNRALAWMDDSLWFFAANWDPCYKFLKDGTVLGSVAGPGSIYGSAYDADWTDGGWIWWHSQNDPGTGWDLQIDQMEPVSMSWTGVSFGYVPTIISSGMAGGLCFYESFRDLYDVLFALVQGDPNDVIVGIYIRDHVPGVEEESGSDVPVYFGFAPSIPNPTKGITSISYITSKSDNVSLKVYDGTGRLVETLINSVRPAGVNTVTWNPENLSNGVYFFNLEANGKIATHKLILVK
jgi:hypothetical protein